MAALHCRYCGTPDDHETGAGFASIAAYDDHLILYKDVENGADYNGRPVCIGQQWGRPITDPNLVRMRDEFSARLRSASRA